VDSEACSTFDAANDTCDNGDVVLVKANAYPFQLVTGSNSRSAPCTIQAASGETVTIVSLAAPAGTNWLTLRDMADRTGETVKGTLSCFSEAYEDGSICIFGDHIMLDNFDITGPYAQLVMENCDGCTWKNSEFGTEGNTTSIDCMPQPEGAPFSAAGNTNLLIDNNNYWQFRGDDPDCEIHLETFRMWEGNHDVVISNNYFAPNGGDDTAHISSSCVNPSTCDENSNMTFINNFFGEYCCGYAGNGDVFWGDNQACTGWTFVYNFLSNGINRNCSSETNFVFKGNVIYNTGGCIFTSSDAGNLFLYNGSHGTCAGNTYLANAFGPSGGNGFLTDWGPLNLNADGYHLTASSPNINAGENTFCTTYTNNLDIDGQARSGVCDAGPDEYVP
jgi:hypothetical protein